MEKGQHSFRTSHDNSWKKPSWWKDMMGALKPSQQEEAKRSVEEPVTMSAASNEVMI
jgi:hypothetical protein